MVTDPVCYTEIDPANAAFREEFRGHTYYFHSSRCRDVFLSDPDEYVAHIPEKVYGDHGRTPADQNSGNQP